MLRSPFNRRQITTAIVFVLGCWALGPAPADAAFAGRLDVPGIAGEAPPPLPNQIEVLGYSWGITKAATRRIAKGTQACGAKAQALQDSIIVTKNTDKATPKLFLAAAMGTPLPTVTLRFFKTDFLYLTITLTNAIVSSITNGVSRFDATTPTEDVTFSFASADVMYTVQDMMGGAGETVSATWNVCDR